MRSFALLLILFAPIAFAGTAAPTAVTANTPAAQLHALFAKAWKQAGHGNGAAHANAANYKTLWSDPARVTHNIYLPLDTAQAKANLAALEKIAPNQLDPSEQLSYRIFEYDLKDAIAANTFAPDQAQALMTQLWGPQLAGNRLRGRHFKNAKGYEHLILRLKALGPYLAAFTRQMKEAMAQGITQPRVVMQDVTEEIEANIASDPTKSPFYAPFVKMPDSIPAAEQTRLRHAASAAITNVVTPAYENFLKFFKDDYLPQTRSKIGVSSLPNGKGFYRFLVRHYTTTDMTPQQVHELGLKLVAQIHGEMMGLIKKTGFKGNFGEFVHYLRTNPRFYYKSKQRLLEAYRAAAMRVNPNLTKILSVWLLPRQPYGVNVIPASLAPNTYPAYADVPYVSVNLYKPQTRPKYSIQVLMCHEGRPGHNLQIPVAAELHNLPKFRRFAYYNAFGEGWALYSETLCNKPMGLYDNLYAKFGFLNYQMWRAVRLVVDTGIHAYGWSRAQAVKYMQQNTALADQNIKTEVNRYIVWPGQALAYMIGERTILSLRKEAKAKLGDKFSLQTFDDAVIGEGSLPLTILKQVVNRWIGRTLAGTPADQLPYASKPRSLGNAMNSDDTETASAGSAGSKPAARQGGESGARQGRPATFGFERASLVNPTTLKVWYGQGYAPCYGSLGKVEVEQGKNAVTITLHRVPPPPHEQPIMCSHMIMLKPVEVHLAAPLGGRSVIDGSSGKHIKLSKGGLPSL